VHTNHYLSPRLRQIEQPADMASSNIRLRRAERLLRRQVGEITARAAGHPARPRQQARLDL